MNKKYSKDYDTKTVMQDDLSIKAEIIEVQKEIERNKKESSGLCHTEVFKSSLQIRQREADKAMTIMLRERLGDMSDEALELIKQKITKVLKKHMPEIKHDDKENNK